MTTLRSHPSASKVGDPVEVLAHRVHVAGVVNASCIVPPIHPSGWKVGVLGSLARRCSAKLAKHVSDGSRRTLPPDLPFGGRPSTRPAILSSRQTDGRRIEMGKLIATTQASVDGVIDPVGEWVQADGDHGDYSFERQARSGGLGLGRKAYEGLAGYWPSQSGKWADMVNPMPKYVGSRTLSGDLEWNATLLAGDLEDSIPKLKDDVDGDLFMHGSGEFAYVLAERGLIDEYEVYLNPLVWGQGNVHVLGDRGTVRMRLDDVKRFESGVVLLTYLPAT